MRIDIVRYGIKTFELCACCPYHIELIDAVGISHYECGLKDSPSNHPGTMCEVVYDGCPYHIELIDAVGISHYECGLKDSPSNHPGTMCEVVYDESI